MQHVKKGFTLIEIAIVLVVIGLILGMVMKGRSLIDAAQLRSEINKINKVQAAYTSFMSKHNRRAGSVVSTGSTSVANTTQAVFNDLINEGMITAADFAIPMLNGSWALVGCASGADGQLWTAATLAAGSSVCLTVSEDAPADNNALSAAPNNARASLKFICYVESMLDDRNTARGQGRGTAAITITDAQYSTCDDLAETADQTYLIRIF